MKTVNVKSLGQCPYLISLELYDVIGRGSYASVCKAFNSDNPSEKLAAKIFDLNDVKKYESAMKELIIVEKIPHHINLVEYKKIKITSKNRLYIIMQECKESLQSKIDKSPEITEHQIWNMINQVCQGYKILQQKSIIHRDLKPDNILIGFDGKYKISDFGLSDILTEFENQHKKQKGSLPFMAPQIIFNKNHSQKNIIKPTIDVYSLGVTVFYTCYQTFPYIASQNIKHKKLSISICDFLNQLKNNPLVFPKNRCYSQELLSFMEGCLEKEANQRFSWEYIYLKLLERSNHTKNEYNQQLVSDVKSKNFRIVEISDAFLKNLSAMDGQLYASLSNQSLVIIDHIQATIISKRQMIFYFDRLYYRMCVINEKNSQKQNCRKSSQNCHFLEFSNNLLVFNYLKCRQLDQEFEKYYSAIDKSELLKCITSQKYKGLRNLIKQDLEFLENTICEKQLTLYSKIENSQHKKLMNNYTAQIYEKCYKIVLKLYELGYYEECKQVDEIQKFLASDNNSFLRKLRKNQNALKQFDRKISGITKEQLQQIVSKQYLHSFRQIDK